MAKHVILHEGKKAFCPNCDGLLVESEPLVLKCTDCKAFFGCVRVSMADRELMFEEITCTEK